MWVEVLRVTGFARISWKPMSGVVHVLSDGRLTETVASTRLALPVSDGILMLVSSLGGREGPFALVIRAVDHDDDNERLAG